MSRDILDLIDSDMDALRDDVRRDIDARLAAGARVRSLRDGDGMVIDEWLDGSGRLVAEPVAPLTPIATPLPAPAGTSFPRRMVAVSGQ